MGCCKRNDITQTEAVDIENKLLGNGIVHSYGQTLDMSGNWNWKNNINCTISKYDNIIKASAERLNLDWRLCAALSFIESGINPNVCNNYSKAGGMWQIIPTFWKDYSPDINIYPDSKFIYDPEVSTLAFEKIMGRHLKKFAKAETENDKIALALQCWHDGSIGKNSPLNWGKRVLGKWGNSNESKGYVPKIINKYREFCKL